MKFQTLDKGNFFLHDNKMFIKIAPVHVGFYHDLMTALEINTGRLWYFNYATEVDKISEVCYNTFRR